MVWEPVEEKHVVTHPTQLCTWNRRAPGTPSHGDKNAAGIQNLQSFASGFGGNSNAVVIFKTTPALDQGDSRFLEEVHMQSIQSVHFGPHRLQKHMGVDRRRRNINAIARCISQVL